MISPRAQFEVELQDLAKKYGFRLVESSAMSESNPTQPFPSGTALWTVYDKDSGAPTEDFMVHFTPFLK